MTPTPYARWLAPTVLGVIALAAPPVRGAERVEWRHDYGAARREAADTGRPMLIDFSTKNCFWCQKLDQTTFRDPAVVAMLNARFVSLKLDADRESQLTQTLRIGSFPTLIMAAPDGKILGMIEGYMEAPRLAEHLNRALNAAVTPDWMARDFQEASKAISAADYARAVALLKSIVEDKKDRPIQTKAAQVLADLEQQAAGRLAHARRMEDRGQTLEAMDTLSEVIKNFAGTQAAADASGLLTTLAAKPEIRDRQRDRRARELLAQAREDFRTQQLFACLERCDLLASTFADLPEAQEAAQLAAQVKDNPESLAEACRNLTDRLGVMYLNLAESYRKKGDAKQAAVCLEKVRQVCPGTPHAETALARLNQIQGRDTQQADFQKP